jgi:hypothetical protein
MAEHHFAEDFSKEFSGVLCGSAQFSAPLRQNSVVPQCRRSERRNRLGARAILSAASLSLRAPQDDRRARRSVVPRFRRSVVPSFRRSVVPVVPVVPPFP